MEQSEIPDDISSRFTAVVRREFFSLGGMITEIGARILSNSKGNPECATL
jgi:hypothetical protein